MMKDADVEIGQLYLAPDGQVWKVTEIKRTATVVTITEVDSKAPLSPCVMELSLDTSDARQFRQLKPEPDAARPEVDEYHGMIRRDGQNMGHGHVYSRADGTRARCGGPGLCAECSRDKAQKDAQTTKFDRHWKGKS